MEPTARLFLCVRCQTQVLICSHCDRGQIYCAGDCRNQARCHAQREAGRRYQTSRQGRFKHAERSRRYRARQNKVTHRGSPSTPSNDLLPLDSALTEAADSCPGQAVLRCHFCGRHCPVFVRNDFLRRRRVPRNIFPHEKRGTPHGPSP